MSNRTADLQSYQQYLLARTLVRGRGAGVHKAIAILESLVARDPDCAPASALLALAYYLSQNYSAATRSVLVDEARRAILSAMERGEIARTPSDPSGSHELGRI